MNKTLDIALGQLSPRLRETEANIATVRSVVAKHPEANLIVFPELFLSGYTVANVDELAIPLSGQELKTLADIARENSTALIIGAAERVSNGIANSAFCLDERGNIAAVYRKVQLYGGDESGAFVPGDELLAVELCGGEGGTDDLLRHGVSRGRESPRTGWSRDVCHDLCKHGALRERPCGIRLGARPGEWATTRLRKPGRYRGEGLSLHRRKHDRLTGWGSSRTSGLFGRDRGQCEVVPSR